jgi:chorismate lyase/3-hydroxybenzoate synthase
MSVFSATDNPLVIRFDSAVARDAGPAGLQLASPVLGGVNEEVIFPPARAKGAHGAFELYQAGDWLLGCAVQPVTPGKIETVARGLYDDLLAAARGRNLCRIWNYVPEINAHEAGMENYRAFCRGRALAFENEFGAAQFERLCAASAVGAGDDRLAVIFAATTATPKHLENPAQVAAYRYPAEHGPRAPSFARATMTVGGRYVFISGTASIKGHATVAPEDTLQQVDCTLDNLALISQAAGLGADLGASAAGRWIRHFKIYLRHAEDFAPVSARLQGSLLRAGDIVTWLQADICRAALKVEIEATLVAK